MKTSIKPTPPTKILPFKARLSLLVGDLRVGIDQTSDPRSQALYETAAEVLLGLIKAFADHDQKKRIRLA